MAESIPGAIAINSSTFVGYKIAGRIGAITAACGVILPSFIIITLIAAFFSRFQNNPIVKAAFMGIRSTVVALILMAAIKIGKKSIKDKIFSSYYHNDCNISAGARYSCYFAIVIGAMVGLLYILPRQKSSENHW